MWLFLKISQRRLKNIHFSECMGYIKLTFLIPVEECENLWGSYKRIQKVLDTIYHMSKGKVEWKFVLIFWNGWMKSLVFQWIISVVKVQET